MKLCITGAGSSRLPLMMASIAQSGPQVREVTLFDIRPDRIRALMPVGLALCSHLGGNVNFRIAESFEDAVEGCSALILTIRPGFEERRALDERICLNQGVIGQETTGPAGFAFATRTIPAVTGYCAIAERLAPGFLPVIFTNPAGMVTQALHDQGFPRAVGICDSATAATKKVADLDGTPFEDVDFEVSGLNHLSWTRRITTGGRDILGPALANLDFLKKVVPWRVQETALDGTMPVEYLFYYLRAEPALAALLTEPATRGEAIVTSNARLFTDLLNLDGDDAVIRYARYLFSRNDSYMSYALGHRHGGYGPETVPDALAYLESEIGGYAEVAMELLTSTKGGAHRIMALNVRNAGSIPELEDDDIVETDCTVDGRGAIPRSHGPMPAKEADLVRRVKKYERLAVGSVLHFMNGKRDAALAAAVDALTVHPLVPSRTIAAKLVEALGVFGRPA